MTIPSNAPRDGSEPQPENSTRQAPDQAIGKLASFNSLENQFAHLIPMCEKVCRKHWHMAEREQYPFWIGIIIIALLGILGMYVKDIQGVGLLIALIMLIGLAVILALHLRSVQGRFGRQWALFASDGELFRFLHDAGTVLGHPVEMGKFDQQSRTNLEVIFPEAVKAVENYLSSFIHEETKTPCLYVPPSVVKQSGRGEAHRVYEVEYRGSITTTLSIRVSKAEAGADVIIGFPPRPSNAETRDRLTASLIGRLQDRMIAAAILHDIRINAGLSPIDIPAIEESIPNIAPHVSRAVQ